MNELALKDIYLYGVSMGGMISQLIAINHPELIKKLVLTSSCSNFNENNFIDWINLAQENKIEELVDCFCKLVYSNVTYKAIEPTLKDYASSVSEKEIDNFIIYARAVANCNISNDICKINIPVLILGSLKDKIISKEDLLFLNENIVNSEIYLYDDYSHAVYDEAVDIKERILDFFNKK